MIKDTKSMFDLQSLRYEIPALANVIYLNTGTFGPMPRPVASELIHIYKQIEKYGSFTPAVFFDTLVVGYEATRAKIATLLHVQADEIALTRNITDGINIIVHGFDWRSGDEVIITDQEHPSGTMPWLNLEKRKGINVHVLELLDDEEEVLRRFQSLFTPRTRLAAFSHVTSASGLRLPVKKMCAFARDAGVPTLVDGAHALGQFAVNLQDLGCDFFAGCGHKWLLAPQGTGMLFVRRELQDQVHADWLGWGLEHEFNRGTMTYRLAPTAARYEAATRPWPLFLAFGTALDFVSKVGLDEIESRVGPLADNLKAQLAQIPGVRVHSPMNGAPSSGLVTFDVDGWESQILMDHLWNAHQIVVNWLRESDTIRASVAFFTSEEELEMLVHAVTELVGVEK
jgi:cysteine desulfurase/selenocysteine lyase